MPTVRGRALAGAVVVLAVTGAAVGVEEFVLLALAGVALLALGALSVRWRARQARRALRLALSVPVPEASVGDVVRAQLVLSACGSAVPPLRVDDPAGCWSVSHPGLGGRPEGAAALPPPASGAGSRPLALPGVRVGAHVTLALDVPTAERGVVTITGPAVRCEDPFGLFTLAVGEGPAGRLLVCPLPAVGGVGPAGRSRAPGARPGAFAPVASPVRQAGDELDSLRPYVPGDRLTRLHWQALARTGDLVVREFTAGDTGRLAVLVDVRPGVDPALLEAAISAAAGLGVRALAAGTAVELCTSAGERLAVAPGTAGQRALLRALAMVGPSVPRRDDAARWRAYDNAGAVWATDNLADAGQVLVTPRPDDDGVLPEALSSRTSVMVVR
jgi:uncharacterized protein (DUF58 family)